MLAGYRARSALRSASRRTLKWLAQIELDGHCSIAAATPCFDWTSQACLGNLRHSASQSGSVELLCQLRVKCEELSVSNIFPLLPQKADSGGSLRDVAEVPKGDMASGSGLQINYELECLYVARWV